jgi:AAA15 family ATPase/GTPase
MNAPVVRISSIEIKNIKSVEYGKIDLSKKTQFSSSILGLYGQNGSGKTALIDSLKLLRYTTLGVSIPKEFCDLILKSAQKASFSFEFIVKTKSNEKYNVFYSFDLIANILSSIDSLQGREVQQKQSEISNECLSYKLQESSDLSKPNNSKKRTIHITDDTSVLAPKVFSKEVIGKDSTLKANLLAQRQIAKKTSTSFLFCEEFSNILKSLINEKENELTRDIYAIISALKFFAVAKFRVIDTTNFGTIALNLLPVNFNNVQTEDAEISGSILVNIQHSSDVASVVSRKSLELLKKSLQKDNLVLSKLIPGLEIEVKELGIILQKDSTEGINIDLLAKRGNETIPLRHESEGVKKIVSILHLLICVYNDPSFTVAIDELDSGIFEFLLGELLEIIAENGNGQLIFTSHNLRPLETIDDKFIAFTTTNPKNRYIRFSGLQKNNSLRSRYFRDLQLGGQEEELYAQTDKSEIDHAFFGAGLNE